MKQYHCFKCKKLMPFLEEPEWDQISPLLDDGIRAIKEYRGKTGCDLKTAREIVVPESMVLFEKITGMAGVHADTIHHHRLEDWGPECQGCGNLLRTNKASYCVACGKKP